MIAAFIVFVHQTIVQFCCSGVTGAIIAAMGMASLIEATSTEKGGQKKRAGAEAPALLT
jgi:hypothetical protein